MLSHPCGLHLYARAPGVPEVSGAVAVLLVAFRAFGYRNQNWVVPARTALEPQAQARRFAKATTSLHDPCKVANTDLFALAVSTLCA